MADKYVYVRANDGSKPNKKLVGMSDNTYAEQVIAHPPVALLTDGAGPSQRIRVDVGQTGFFAGRMMYAYYKFSLPVGQSIRFKFVSPVDWIVYGFELLVRGGGAGISFYTEDGVTETDAFETDITPHLSNNMSERPNLSYTALVAIQTGGELTGGTEVDYIESQTASQQIAAASIISGIEGERGLAAGTFYARMAPLSGVNDTTVGVIRLVWEEREAV